MAVNIRELLTLLQDLEGLMVQTYLLVLLGEALTPCSQRNDLWVNIFPLTLIPAPISVNIKNQWQGCFSSYIQLITMAFPLNLMVSAFFLELFGEVLTSRSTKWCSSLRPYGEAHLLVLLVLALWCTHRDGSEVQVGESLLYDGWGGERDFWVWEDFTVRFVRLLRLNNKGI